MAKRIFSIKFILDSDFHSQSADIGRENLSGHSRYRSCTPFFLLKVKMEMEMVVADFKWRIEDIMEVYTLRLSEENHGLNIESFSFIQELITLAEHVELYDDQFLTLMMAVLYLPDIERSCRTRRINLNDLLDAAQSVFINLKQERLDHYTTAHISEENILV